MVTDAFWIEQYKQTGKKRGSVGFRGPEADLSSSEMVLVVEFRIPMPLNCEEYRIGNLYATAKTSKLEAEK